MPVFRDDRGTALREIGTLFRAGTLTGVGDGALLERFLSGRGEAAEAAFAALVDRHGPMVLRVCRRALKDKSDAEDAFQATFLALLRGARAIRKRDSVASWLHGTALRVSACSRASGARRRAHEGRFAALRLFEQPEPEADDLHAIVHEEVGRLPARYRAAIVLCDLEGLSHLEASRRLGWPIGTIKSRVSRGRERLKLRLVRRGLAPGVGWIGVLAQEAKATFPTMLAEATVRLAMGQRMAGAVSPAVRLADLFQRSLFMGRLRMMVGVATFGVLAAGATLLAQQGPGARPGGRASQNAEEFTGPYKVIYSVSNLVKWVPEDRDGHRPPVDMNPLIDLITSTVAPGTWKDRDAKGQVQEGRPGVGSITQFDTNLSLIITQTSEGHAQVKERLDQLSRLMSAREERRKPGDATVHEAVETRKSAVADLKASRVDGLDPNAKDDGRKALSEVIDPNRADWANPKNDRSWKDPTQAEIESAHARKLFDEGTKAYKSANFAKAVKSFEDGMKVWNEFLKKHPNHRDGFDKIGVEQIGKLYVRAYQQLGEPIPKNSPFLALFKDGEDDNTVDPTKPAAKPTAAPGSSGMPMMMGSGGGSANPPTAGGYPGMMSGSAMMGGYPGMGSPPGTAASKPTKPGAPGQAMASGMAGYGSSPGPNGETEKRLRAVEEKLDRLLKLLDTPKPDRGESGLRR